MTTLYSNLTAQEIELLDILQEEAAELITAIAKIKRHGKKTVDHVAQPPRAYDNAYDAACEAGQVLGMLAWCAEAGLLDWGTMTTVQATLKADKLPYTHHQQPRPPA